MAGALKQSTNLTGLAVVANPQKVLIRIYGKISKLLAKMPESSAYRKYTQDIITKRAAIVNSTDSVKVMEEKIGCGQIEEVILQARNELELAQNFLIIRPWESLTTPVPKNQWKWPVK